MTKENYDALLEMAMQRAKKVGVTFLKEYLNSSLAQELSNNEEDFCNDEDFKVGLFAKLFYEYKKLDVWDEISDDDWDNLCNLSMSSAFEEFSQK